MSEIKLCNWIILILYRVVEWLKQSGLEYSETRLFPDFIQVLFRMMKNEGQN